jgi:hypothetical protein
VIFTLVSFSVKTNAQFGETLWQKEKQFFLSKSDSVKTVISFAKLNQLLSSTNVEIDRCLKEINRIDPSYLSRTKRSDFYWNSAICNLLEKKGPELVYARRYFEITQDTSLAAQLLYFMVATQYESFSNEVGSNITNPELKNFMSDYQSRNALMAQKKGYTIASAIVPGSGMMLKGHFDKGLTSLALNGGSAFLAYSLFKNNLYGNALGVTGLLLSRFYMGNIRFTQKLKPKKGHKKLSRKMELYNNQFNQLLLDHPINFK